MSETMIYEVKIIGKMMGVMLIAGCVVGASVAVLINI